jgi:hypothetical protein
MIEQAARILREANASQMQLNIRIDGDKVTVIANTMLNPTSKDESAEALKLRAALTQPIVISGDIGEVDVSITDALIQYTDTYINGANAHSNLLDVKVKTEKATKTASKSSPKKSTPDSLETVDDEAVANAKVSTVSLSGESKEKAESPEKDAFMFDEADSL